MQQVNATSFRWTMDAAGDWLCVQTNKARQVLDALKEGQVYDVEIKEHREKRSLDANNMCWKICTDIADAIGTTKNEVYRKAIKEVGVYTPLPIKEEAVKTFQKNWEERGAGWILEVVDDSKIPGYKLCFAYFGSSTYTTKEMSRLIDNLIYEAKCLGLDEMSDRERSLLLESWESAH